MGRRSYEAELAAWVHGTDDLPLAELEGAMPAAHSRLIEAAKLLEREHGDVQDIEFTVERGELFQ